MVDARNLGAGWQAFFRRADALDQLEGALESWRRPINANSPAMQDGRSKPPTPPLEVRDELTCAAINRFLGTNYRVSELLDMPDAWLEKMRLLINAVG